MEIKTRADWVHDEQRIAECKFCKLTKIYPPAAGLSAYGRLVNLWRIYPIGWIYTHVSNVAKNKIVSPLDNLKLGKKDER